MTKMRHSKTKFIAALFLLTTLVSGAVRAQQVQPAVRPAPAPGNRFVYDKVQSLKLSSKLMARDMPYRVVLPNDYSTSNETKRYPVIYLLHGLTGHFDNWTDKTKLAQYAASYKFIVVTPEGGDGWYTDSSTILSDKYEDYIIKE